MRPVPSIGRQLHSPEEMDALESHSQVIDRTNDVYVKMDGTWYVKNFGFGYNRDLPRSTEEIFEYAPIHVLKDGQDRVEHHCDQPPLPPPPAEKIRVEVAPSEADEGEDVLKINGFAVAHRFEMPQLLWQALTDPECIPLHVLTDLGRIMARANKKKEQAS